MVKTKSASVLQLLPVSALVNPMFEAQERETIEVMVLCEYTGTPRSSTW